MIVFFSWILKINTIKRKIEIFLLLVWWFIFVGDCYLNEIIEIGEIGEEQFGEESENAIVEERVGLGDLVQENEMNRRAVGVDFEIAGVHDDQLDPFEQSNRHDWKPEIATVNRWIHKLTND